MGGIVKSVVSVVSKVASVFTGGNPLVSLGVSLFLGWVLRPKVPDIPDFGTNEFDDFEKGILINKQSNDSNIPVIYGERLVGGTRVFMEKDLQGALGFLWKLLEQIILTFIWRSLCQRERLTTLQKLELMKSL